MNLASVAVRLRRYASHESPLSRYLIGTALWSLLLNVSARVLMLVASILLARQLGAEGFGIYATALSLITLLGLPTQLGLPTLLVRLIASYRLHMEWGLMRGLLRHSYAAVLLLAALFGAVAGVILWYVGRGLQAEQVRTLWPALALLPLLALSALNAATLRGLHNVALGLLPQNLILPGAFVVSLVAWQLGANSLPALTPQLAMALYVSAAAIAVIASAGLLLAGLPQQLRSTSARYDIRGWMRAALPLLLLAGMGAINTRTDVVMLTAIQGPESAGLYQAAARGAELVTFALVVVNVAIQPTIARLYAGGDHARLQRVITAAARGTFALAVAAALVLIFFGEHLLGLAFGHEFGRGKYTLGILCGAHIVNAGAGPVALILNMTGHERESAVGMAIGAVVNVALNAALIPLWDIEGAAAATAVSMILWNMMLLSAVGRRTGLGASVFGARSVARVHSGTDSITR